MVAHAVERFGTQVERCERHVGAVDRVVVPARHIRSERFLGRVPRGAVAAVVRECNRFRERHTELGGARNPGGDLRDLDRVSQTRPQVIVFGCDEDLAFPGESPPRARVLDAIEITFEGDAPDRLMHLHVGVATLDNVVCFTADSRLDGQGPFAGAGRVRISLDKLPLGKGEFVASVFLGDENALALYDTRRKTFRVESDSWRNGLMRPPIAWENLPAGGAR